MREALVVEVEDLEATVEEVDEEEGLVNHPDEGGALDPATAVVDEGGGLTRFGGSGKISNSSLLSSSLRTNSSLSFSFPFAPDFLGGGDKNSISLLIPSSVSNASIISSLDKSLFSAVVEKGLALIVPGTREVKVEGRDG